MSPSPPRSLGSARALTQLAVALAMLVLLPAAALAHAVLSESHPRQGEVLSAAPTEVVVSFNEPIAAAFTPLKVVDQAGARVDTGDARILQPARDTVRVDLKPLPPGIYTAVYRVTSLDSHPVEGSITFSVGLPLDRAASPALPPVRDFGAAAGSLRGVELLAVAVLAGLPLFLTAIWWPTAGRGPAGLAWALWALASLAGAAGLAIYGVRLSGEALTPAVLLQTLLQTRNGWLWGVRVLLGGLTALLLHAWDRKSGWGALAPAAGLLVTLSLQSHAMAAGGALDVLLDWVHLAAAALWAGGLAGFALVMLPALRRSDPPDKAEQVRGAVRRFTRLATLSVILLILTGLFAALRHIPSLEALTTTGYGRILLIKLALIVPLLALGALHWRREGGGRFRLTVGGELLLMCAVFAAAGLLSTHAPATAELAARQGPVAQSARENGFQIDLQVDPARPGTNEATVTVKRPDGSPETGASLVLRVISLEMDMGTLTLDGVEGQPGVYVVQDVLLGMDGDWEFTVSFLTGDGREVRRAFKITAPYPQQPTSRSPGPGSGRSARGSPGLLPQPARPAPDTRS